VKASDASYLAGFLDGDGSIHFQLVRALWLLPQLGPRLDVQESLRMAREVDTFAALNYSKTKRISAVDVEQHPRSKGVVAPVTTSPIPLDRGDGSPATWQIYETHNTPAPRNGVKV
jgi:hypothetical protein